MAEVMNFNARVEQRIAALDPEQLAWQYLLNGLALSTHERELVDVLVAAKCALEGVPIKALNEFTLSEAQALRHLARTALASLDSERVANGLELAAEILCESDWSGDTKLHQQDPRVQASLRKHAKEIVAGYHEGLQGVGR